MSGGLKAKVNVFGIYTEWAVSSAVEHFLDMEGATSSILVPPTIISK